MNGLKKIIYNCRKATFLIEKKQLAPLTVRENLELKIHLAGCSICRRFQQQSIMINTMIHRIFKASNPNELKLDDTFKRDLQERIEKELRKE